MAGMSPSKYTARDLDAGEAAIERAFDEGTRLLHHIATAIAAERERIVALLTAEAAAHPQVARQLRAVINAIDDRPAPAPRAQSR